MPVGGMTDFLSEAMIWIDGKPVGKMSDVTITTVSDFEEETVYTPMDFSNDMSYEFKIMADLCDNKFFDKLVWGWNAKGPIRKKQILKMRRKYYGY